MRTRFAALLRAAADRLDPPSESSAWSPGGHTRFPAGPRLSPDYESHYDFGGFTARDLSPGAGEAVREKFRNVRIYPDYGGGAPTTHSDEPVECVLPVGEFRLQGPVSVPNNVTVRGAEPPEYMAGACCESCPTRYATSAPPVDYAEGVHCGRCPLRYATSGESHG